MKRNSIRGCIVVSREQRRFSFLGEKRNGRKAQGEQEEAAAEIRAAEQIIKERGF